MQVIVGGSVVAAIIVGCPVDVLLESMGATFYRDQEMQQFHGDQEVQQFCREQEKQ